MIDSVDILIEGGTIVDGTGAPGYPGSVAIVGQTLRVLPSSGSADDPPAGGTDIRAGRRIDARGHVVAPGFIDLHSHGGLTILADPRHEPKVRQGVTTEVIGVDGNAYAPFRTQHDLDDFLTLNAGLDGRPDGVAYDWRTVADYLARFDRGVAVNIAYLIGNSALRIAAVGWDEVEPSAAQMADQRALLREGLEEGAFGLSTGLDYPPGAYASTHELADLLAEAVKLGGFYHTHVRYPLGDAFLDPFREAIEIGRRGGGPVHITHFYHRATFPGSPAGHARARRRRPGRGPRRQLRPVSLRVGEHASPDHAADLDPGRWRGRAQGPPRRPDGPGADPDRAGGPGPVVRRGGGLGRPPDGLLRPTRARALGGPDASAPTSPRRASIRSTDCATCSCPRTSGSTRSHPGRIGRGWIRSSPTPAR